MLLLSDLSRRIHHQYTVFEEEYRYGTQISEVIPKVLIVRPHKNFRLILFPNEIPDALVGRHDTAGVFARFLDNFFGFVKCAADLGSS